MVAASTDLRPEQVPNANYTRVPDFRQCPLLALKNDREGYTEACLHLRLKVEDSPRRLV